MNYDARMLDAQTKEVVRIRVAVAVVDQGMRQTDAVRLFHVSRTSVHEWARAYKAGGLASLKAHKVGRPARSRLAGLQAATVVRLIKDRTPDQMKMPFVLWTRQAVAELIARRTGHQVSVWTVGRYLKRWGFTPQKPLRRAYEQDPAAVQHWLDVEYPAIVAQARREQAQIHWGDEMGLRSDHQAGTSYGIKGRTPVIPGTGKRFGCNMISTITNRGRLSFMVFKERFTALVMIRFMERLVRQSACKVLLIVDGHPVHRSAAVRAWVNARPQRIELFRLPGYAPQLNPDELLNQDVKSNALGRRRPADQADLLADIRGYLRSTQRHPEVVRSYFEESNVRYAAS